MVKCQKGHLKEYSYHENVDYIVLKQQSKTQGRPKELILLTTDCFKRLCMLYYIQLEHLVDKYKKSHN